MSPSFYLLRIPIQITERRVRLSAKTAIPRIEFCLAYTDVATALPSLHWTCCFTEKKVRRESTSLLPSCCFLLHFTVTHQWSTSDSTSSILGRLLWVKCLRLCTREDSAEGGGNTNTYTKRQKIYIWRVNTFGRPDRRFFVYLLLPWKEKEYVPDVLDRLAISFSIGFNCFIIILKRKRKYKKMCLIAWQFSFQ